MDKIPLGLGSLIIPDSNLQKSQNEATTDQSEEEELRYAVIEYIKTTAGRDQFVREITDQLLLQNSTSWGEMLSAAPRALCSIGQCFIAGATFDEISTLMLSDKYGLQDLSLRTNLAECSNLGRLAFHKAHKEMNRIQRISGDISGPDGPIQRILEDLEDEELAQIDLGLQIKDLKESSKTCSEATLAVNEAFRAWQDFANMLFLACTAAGDQANRDAKDLTNKVATAAFQLNLQDDEKARSEEETKRLKGVAKVNEELLRKKADALPTGWNAIAQDTFSTFVGTIADFANKIPTLPISMKFLNFYKNSVPEPPSPQSAGPDTRMDFGLDLSGRMAKPMQNLRTCLTNGRRADSDVDWNRLFGHSRASSGPARTQEAQIVVIANTLRTFKGEAFLVVNDSQASETSKEAYRILNVALHVSEEVEMLYQAQASMEGAAASRSAGDIADWQEQISNAVEDNETLLHQRDRIEGRRGKAKVSKAKEAPTKSSQKWAHYKHVRQSYELCQKALAQSDQHLVEQAERQRISARKFDEVQKELFQLKAEKATMPQIIKILTKCLNNLVEFREHLDHLKKFFDGLEDLVVTCEKAATKYIGSAESTSKYGPAAKRKIMDRLLLDAVSLRGHYTVTREIASVYVEVSKSHILPGVNFIERLGLVQPEDGSKKDMEEMALELDGYAKDAMKKIQLKAEKRRARLRDKLFDQGRELEDVEQALLGQGDAFPQEEEDEHS